MGVSPEHETTMDCDRNLELALLVGTRQKHKIGAVIIPNERKSTETLKESSRTTMVCSRNIKNEGRIDACYSLATY